MMARGTDVLVVDDEPDVRTSVVEILRDAGYEVEEAADGQEALDLLSHHPVGAMILDLVMPGRDGMSLMEALDHPPPTLVVSAHRPDPDKMRALSAKVVAVLEKPVPPRQLIDRVAALLRSGEGK